MTLFTIKILQKQVVVYLITSSIALILLSLTGCAKTGQAVHGLLDNVTTLKDELKELKVKVWDKTKGYQGVRYSPTDRVVPTFQDQQVPVSCRVFAHLLVQIPKGFTGKSIAQAVEAEATARGADMLLIGGTRQATDAEAEQAPLFSYYGPEQPYKCRDYWNGWKFAYEDWVDQGDWVTIGYDEWGSLNAHFNSPLIMQVAFLRCSE
ncbi:MAG: hypothetical protein D3919_09375 [Candidatus Electrothrix sp. AW5]|nr:hypothetical protein [Candidatus Electrothrix gigas]